MRPLSLSSPELAFSPVLPHQALLSTHFFAKLIKYTFRMKHWTTANSNEDERLDKYRQAICFAALLYCLAGGAFADKQDDYAAGVRASNEGNYKQALEWYKKAADQGDAAAQNAIGAMYHQGHGVTQDYKQALEWYRKAAEQGNAKAQSNLGNMYAAGMGVTHDNKQAVEWYRKAAEQGNKIAQTRLGVMYSQGLGVAPDKIEALKWLNLVMMGNVSDDTTINQLRSIFEKGMTATEIAEAQKRASEWQADFDKRH